MARKQAVTEKIRLSSDVTITVEASSSKVYDSLDIQRVNGVVIVALPGKTPAFTGPYVTTSYTTGETDNMLASDDPAIVAARSRLLGQFPDGASSGGVAHAPVSRAVTADELAAQAGFDTNAIQRSIAAATGGNFTGRSNEDDVDA